jgi:hypothetical protein
VAALAGVASVVLRLLFGAWNKKMDQIDDGTELSADELLSWN